jgi:hypothetical protein
VPDPAALEAHLRRRDPEALAEALGAIVRLGPAARPLRPSVERLASHGLPPPLARLALEALGAIGARESAPVLRRHLRHRHAEVRLAAARALGRVGGPVAVAALREALGDADRGVRGEAASALGALGAADAAGDLLRAFDGGVPEAGPAFGHVCPPGACADLASRLRARPFAELAPALEAVLWRPAAQVGDAPKVALVRELHALPPADVHPAIAAWHARWTGSPAVRDALARAAAATGPAP